MGIRLKFIGIILLILFSVGVIFFIKGKIHERRAWLDFDDFSYALASTSPVNETVKEIHVVQDHQRLYENGEQTFDI